MCWQPSPAHRSLTGSGQRLTGGELNEDAADAPDVARVAPAEAQNDLRGSVVPRGDDGGVVVGVKGGAAEVDDFDLAGFGDSPSDPAQHACACELTSRDTERRDTIVADEVECA